MRARIAARVVALVLTGVLLTVAYWFIAASHYRLGREAFLRSEARYFDRYAHSDAAARTRTLVAELLLSATIVGVYELLAFGTYKIISVTRFARDAHKQT
jgi:hypothetical protein